MTTSEQVSNISQFSDRSRILNTHTQTKKSPGQLSDVKTKLMVIWQKVDQIQRRMVQLQEDLASQQREDTGKLSS